MSNYGARGAKLNIDLKSVVPCLEWTFESAKNSAKNRKFGSHIYVKTPYDFNWQAQLKRCQAAGKESRIFYVDEVSFYHAILKVKFLSKKSILTKNIFTSFYPNIFDIFSGEIKVQS